jgi:hypothetical protein
MSDTVPTPSETPAEHLRHAISDALRHLDREAEALDDHRFAGVARAILRGQTATLARLAEVERELEQAKEMIGYVPLSIRDKAERAEAAERERDDWKLRAADRREEADRNDTKLRARAEAAEQRLRKAEEWIQEVDHVEDCAAFDRASSRECDCGRTAVLKRARTTTTEEVPHA